MNIPVILYDLEKKIILQNSNIKTNCQYFYSYRNFEVKIISGIGIIYSVKQLQNDLLENYLETQEGQEFQNNFGYTLYIPENKTSVVVEISNSYETKQYTFNLEYDNIIDETNEHYNDLLINNYLPTYTELEKCIPDEFEQGNLIKRLLLDFKTILKYKGTKKSIEKILNFIGFGNDNLNIYEEYFNRKSNTFNVNPNKKTDIKTGNYHVIYDNFTHGELDANNMPQRYIVIDDLDKFSEHLLNAIALINIYFTCEEQEIIFFALNYSSNIPSWAATTSSMNMIVKNDVFGFRKDIHIDMNTFFSSSLETIIIENCYQKVNSIFKSECKYFIDQYLINKTNSEIYFVDYEIFDDEIIDPSLDWTKIERVFGNIINLNILSPNVYVEFELLDKNNPFSKLIFPKQYVSNFINKTIVLIKTSEYRLTIKLTDKYNNVESYIYDFNVNIDIQQIDFEVFNSTELRPDNNKNKIILDIDSQVETIVIPEIEEESKSFIISPLSSIPEDMNTYFDTEPTEMFRWLTENKKHNITSLNLDYSLDSITETIPLDLFHNWLDLISFKYDPLWNLKLRVYDKNLGKKILINYEDITQYDPTFDILYLMVMDIFDRLEDGSINPVAEPFYFITTIDTGIEINKNTFDFVLVNTETSVIKSIYSMIDNTEIFRKKIPVNHDFPLFPIVSELAPTLTTYISPSKYVEEYIAITETKTLNTIRSLFTRLINVSEDSYHLSYSMKIFDIILCRLNDKYVVNSTDIVWKVFNSFTNELLFETKDFALKYQITENLCFDVSCNFLVNGLPYTIFKKSLFSSFKINE